MTAPGGRPTRYAGPADPEWYRDSIIYELHVRAFYDDNADGIGDFRGLIRKLDYLKELGITAVWLLPFYPSPLKDDGYDVTDYTGVHPAHGDLGDVRRFVREAHKRDIRVITELIMNHTSDQHPWFQRARRAKPGSAARDFYVWSDTAREYADARIIFQDFETSNWSWDAVAGAYYWHRFYRYQPDLNFRSPAVKAALVRALDFWFDLGVDGLRLDAIPYLYERDGTICENLPETHAFLRDLRRHVDSRHRNRMLLAEANQWPEDAAAYFGKSDECHVAFHFPLMPRLFMAVRMEDRFPIVDILSQTPEPPPGCQWAIFLRNHDELTLEMVSDEERHFMYRHYAATPESRVNLGIRRRLMPLMGNHRRRVELMLSLLFSLPGTPVLYYGDEIGMGDNIFLGDRNGVRTPMQWSADRNAGFSGANRQRLYLPVIVDPEYHYEAVNVESQAHNPHSLLSWTKRVIALRRRHGAFGRGALDVVGAKNMHILAFTRRHEDETILVVANLSRFAQAAELDLSAHAGFTPIEMFSDMAFPAIGAGLYALTFGPHDFFWFTLRAPVAPAETPAASVRLRADSVDALLRGERSPLAPLLADHLPRQRWFGAKGRRPKNVTIEDIIPVAGGPEPARLVILSVDVAQGERQTYVLPLALVPEEGPDPTPATTLAIVEIGGRALRLKDTYRTPALAGALVEAMRSRRMWKGAAGQVVGRPAPALRTLLGTQTLPSPGPGDMDQTNTSVAFGQSVMLKMFRRLDVGDNPEITLGRFLTEVAAFPNAPALAGHLTYHRDGAAMPLGVLHAFVPNAEDGFAHAQAHLKLFLDAVRSQAEPVDLPWPGSGQDPFEPAAAVVSLIGGYLDASALLGQRTAELHLALASRPDLPDFAPTAMSVHDTNALYQSMRTLTGQTFAALRAERDDRTDRVRAVVEQSLALEERVQARLKNLVQGPTQARRIRCHGDYHLGQVLFTGQDFMIVDFEGEPARPLAERSLKHCALKDVAGMLRSFDYAAQTAVRSLDHEGADASRAHGRLWTRWVSAAFVARYRATLAGRGLVPEETAAFDRLLEAFLLEKALYELRYELSHRPDWAGIPLEGLRAILDADPGAAHRA